MRKDEINQSPIGLIDRYRQLGGLQFRKIVVGVQFEKHQVINPRLKFLKMNCLLFAGHMMIRERTQGHVAAGVQFARNLFDPVIQGRDA